MSEIWTQQKQVWKKKKLNFAKLQYVNVIIPLPTK